MDEPRVCNEQLPDIYSRNLQERTEEIKFPNRGKLVFVHSIVQFEAFGPSEISTICLYLRFC